MRRPVSIIVVSLLGLTAFADVPDSWRPLTNAKKPACNAEAPCRVLESNGAFELTFDSKDKWNSRQFRRVSFKSLRDGSVQTFDVNDVNNVDQNQFFKFYSLSLRGDANIDLALFTYSSAAEGEMYHYFVYDPAEHRFVYNEQTNPRMVREPNGVGFYTPLHKTRYVLDANFKLAPNEKP